MAVGTPNRNSLLERSAGIALWLLLAGYLLFNKPFATLGIAPVYIGETVFALALAGGLADWRATFLEPLRRSWGYQVLAGLWLYAVLRALWDAQYYGILALRDGAVIGYGLLAFLAPALWKKLRGSGEARELALHAGGVVLPIALLAVVASASVLFGWAPREFNLRVKIDFVSLAAAVGGWISFCAALLWIAVGAHYSQARRRDGVYRWILVAFYIGFSLWAWSLVVRMPTRAVLVSVAPLTLLLAAVWLEKTWQRAAYGAALVLLAGLTLFAARERLTQFATFPERFALKGHAEIPLPELEQRLARAMAGDATAVPEEIRMRYELLLPAHDPALARGPNYGEHSLRWRVVFWQRCWYATQARAPLTGTGFGSNLTALMLTTRAWPDYVHSQQFDPPNRSPHAIHVTVFARLGFLGLALWLALLALILAAGLRAAWHWRAQSERRSREAFYGVLMLLGFWTILLCAASFGVVLEGPHGGMWFWVLSGLLLSFSPPGASETQRFPG